MLHINRHLLTKWGGGVIYQLTFVRLTMAISEALLRGYKLYCCSKITKKFICAIVVWKTSKLESNPFNWAFCRNKHWHNKTVIMIAGVYRRCCWVSNKIKRPHFTGRLVSYFLNSILDIEKCDIMCRVSLFRNTFFDI